MRRFITALLLLAGCKSEEFLPAGSERACVTMSSGTMCAVSYERSDGVREDDVEAQLNNGKTEKELEEEGYVVIVPLVEWLDQVAERVIVDGPALYFWVQPGTSTNVYYYPAESICYNVWYWTDASAMSLNMYWQKDGPWVHWRTIKPMVKNVAQHTGGIWSNGDDDQPGAATYRFKFSNNNVKAKQVRIDIEVIPGDVDCYEYP